MMVNKIKQNVTYQMICDCGFKYTFTINESQVLSLGKVMQCKKCGGKFMIKFENEPKIITESEMVERNIQMMKDEGEISDTDYTDRASGSEGEGNSVSAPDRDNRKSNNK